MDNSDESDQTQAPEGTPRSVDPVRAPRPQWQPLDRQGRERPQFLAGFPSDPALDVLVEAFGEGNFALIRREARRLAATTHDSRVRAAALELYRRIQPDPVVLVLLATSLGLFAWLVAWAY